VKTSAGASASLAVIGFCEWRFQVVTEHKGACCSSPATMCYWFAASLIAWGVLSFIGIFWRPLHGSSAATILFAMAMGCVANWLRNRTLHCGITGPLFLIAALVFLVSDVTMTHVNSLLVWPFVVIGVGIAFLLEWRYTKPSASQL
jgi:hypothetical protein